MIVSLVFLAIVFALLAWTLRHQAGQSGLTGFVAWVFNVSRATASIFMAYLAVAAGLLSLMSFIVLIGLVTKAHWIVYAGLAIFGGLLLILTYIIEFPLSTLATVLSGIRQTATEAVDGIRLGKAEIAKAIETMPEGAIRDQVEAHLPKAQGWIDWILGLFDLGVIRGAGVKIIDATLGNAEKLVKAALQATSGVKIILLWFGIVLFITRFIPNAATPELLIPLGFGIALLVIIANYKGEAWRTAHGLGDIYWNTFRLIKAGVWGLVIALTFVCATPLAQSFVPHILVAMNVKGPEFDEDLAKDIFGQNFDQRLCRVVAPVHRFYRQGDLYIEGPIMFPGMVLWRNTDGDSTWTYRSKRYARYFTQSPDGLPEHSGKEVLVPESAVQSLRELTTRTARVDKGVVFYADSNGVASLATTPAGMAMTTPASYEEAYVTEIQTQIYGVVVNLCIIRENERTLWVWLRNRDLHFTTSS